MIHTSQADTGLGGPAQLVFPTGLLETHHKPIAFNDQVFVDAVGGRAVGAAYHMKIDVLS